MATLLASPTEPHEGLVIGKKERYYKHPAVVLTAGEGNQKKALQNAIGNFLLAGRSLDTKKNKVGIRLIRQTEQFSPDYKAEVIKVRKVVPRSPEDKFDPEEPPVAGTEVYADFIEMGAERKTEKVKVVASRGKDILIESEEGLQYAKLHHVFNKDLEYKEKTESIGKIKSEIFRFIGIDFDFTGGKAKIRELALNVYIIKCAVKLTKITSSVTTDPEKKENIFCFEAYSTKDADASDIVPGRVVSVFTNEGIKFFILLEKTPTKDGIAKSFNLFELFKVEPKKKKKAEVDIQSKLKDLFDDNSADEDEEF